MKLKLMIPERVLIDQEAAKIVARAENGYFCLLPHHVDFVSILAPGVLTFKTSDGKDQHVAIGEGTLVKSGDEVTVSTRHATLGDDLEELKQIVVNNYLTPEASESRARAVADSWQSEFASMYLKANKHLRSE